MLSWLVLADLWHWQMFRIDRSLASSIANERLTIFVRSGFAKSRPVKRETESLTAQTVGGKFADKTRKLNS